MFDKHGTQTGMDGRETRSCWKSDRVIGQEWNGGLAIVHIDNIDLLRLSAAVNVTMSVCPFAVLCVAHVR